MTETQPTPTPAPFTSIDRVVHIPLVESGISTLHSTLSNTPLLRTPYNISLSISSSLKPYVTSASTHYPIAPFLSYGDYAANKTLDIAQEKFPYAFSSKPEQVWDDVRSVADERVIRPAVSVAKSVDQSLTPLVDTFSSVVKKFNGEAEDSGAPSDDSYQIQRAYALIRVLKDDVVRISNDEQNAIVNNIHATLTRLTQQSSALLTTIRSRSDDATNLAHQLAQSVLTELDRLPPLVSALTTKTSGKLKDTTNSLRTILAANEPLAEKLPKVRSTISEGVKDVVEDIVGKVHDIVEDLRNPKTTEEKERPKTLHVDLNEPPKPEELKEIVAASGAA